MRDAMRAGKMGQSPSFSDDHLFLLRDGDPSPEPLLDSLISAPLPDQHAELWQVFRAL